MSTNAHHRRDVQGLRGLAVLLVVLFHAGLPFPGGFVGVDVFFVISGYVITLNLLRELSATQTFDLFRFYARRFRRLLPAAAVMSACVLVASVVLLSPGGSQQGAAHTAIAASLFSANLYLMAFGHDYFGPAADRNPFLHTWSLSVEEQFYAVLPGIIWLIWRFAAPERRIRTFLGVILAGSAVSFALSVGFAWTTRALPIEPAMLGFYLPVTRAWEFGLGVWLAVAAPRRPGGPVATAVASAAVVGIVISGLLLHEGPRFPGAIALLPAVATALLLWVTPASRLWDALLSHRSMGWLGDVSYSWYLWHWPFIVFAPLVAPASGTWVLAVAAILSLLPAWVSWKWVETPLRQQATAGRVRLLLQVAVWMLVPLALAVGLRQGARWGWGLEVPEGWSLRPVAHLEPCGDGFTGDSPETTCAFGPENPSGYVLLVGDSHVASLTEGVLAAVEPRNLAVEVLWKSRCPLIRGRWNTASTGCEAFQQHMWSVIETAPPAAVVIANRHLRYLRRSDHAGRPDAFILSDAEGNPVADDAASAESYAQGLRDAVAVLQARGIPVIVVAPVPQFPRFGNEISLYNHRSLSSPTISAAEQAEQRAPLQALLNEIDAFGATTAVLDPALSFCDATECSAMVGDEWGYYDDNHLNPVGSLHLAPQWRTTFERVLGPVQTAP